MIVCSLKYLILIKNKKYAPQYCVQIKKIRININI